MSARNLAGLLLCLVALAAPWLLGAKVRVPGVIWISCGLLVAAVLLTTVSLIRVGRFRPPKVVLACVAILLGYLAVFAWKGEPEFATEFSKELFTELEAGNPAGFIAPPWSQRLALHAACLMTILTASQLARGRLFRRRMAFSFGFSALAVAGVSLAQRSGALGILPWVLVEGTPERCNAGFFHYSATAACINLGWPFIVFTEWGWGSRRMQLGLKAAAFTLAMAALIPLRAEAATAVAVLMLVGGVLWKLLARQGLAGRRLVRATVVAGFLAVGTWQFLEVQKVHRRFPDGWTGAAETAIRAPERDKDMKARSMSRGDRMVVSQSPLRPTLWLAGVRMALDHPVAGEGPGSWPMLLAVYSNDPGANSFFHALQFTHNDLLQFAAEWGILPAILLFAMFVRALLGGTVLPGLVLLGLALHSSVDFPMQCPALMVGACMMLGWGLKHPLVRPHVVRVGDPDSSSRSAAFTGPKMP